MDAFEKALKPPKAKSAPIKVEETSAPDLFDKALSNPEAQEAMGPDFIGPAGSAKSTAGLLNGLDFLDSPIRAGVDKFIDKGDFGPSTPIGEKLSTNFDAAKLGLSSAKDQLIKNFKAPLSAPGEAPTYGDTIDRELGKKFPDMAPSTRKTTSFLGGIAADMAMPSALAKVAKGTSKLDDYLKRAGGSFKNLEREQTAKVIAKFETPTMFENSKVNPEHVANVLVDNELSQYANDPHRIYEALTGEKATTYNTVAPNLSQEITKKSPGLIQRKSEEMRKLLTDVADQTGIEIDAPKFTQNQVESLKREILSPLGGEVDTAESFARKEKIANDLLKPWEDVLVPGVPTEAAFHIPKRDVPPPIPLDDPDMLPFTKQVDVLGPPTTPPLKPTRDQFPLAPTDQIPRGKSRDAVIKDVYPRPPSEPSNYGGVVGKEAQTAYDKELKAWEKQIEKIDNDYEKAAEKADKHDTIREKYRVQSAELRSSSRNQAYDSAIKDWEREVYDLGLEYQKQLKNAGKIDDLVMETKIKQAADRFEQKNKSNEAYRKEVMDVNGDFNQQVQDALTRKVMPHRRQWSLRDLMELRTNIGKKLSSGDFQAAGMAGLAPEKQVMERVYDALRNEIKASLDGKQVKAGDTTIDAATYYDVQSNALRRMIEAKEILKKTIKGKFRESDLNAQAMAVAAGAGTAGVVGGSAYLLGGGQGMAIPTSIAAIAGTTAAYKLAKENAPGIIAKGARLGRKTMEAGSDLLSAPVKQFPDLKSGLDAIRSGMQNETLMKGIGAGARQIRDNYVEPQAGDEGYMPPQTYMPRRAKSLLEEMGNTPLPRSTEELWNMKELVFAKFMQDSPDNAGSVVASAKQGKEQFKKNLSFLINSPDPMTRETLANMFEDDKYNRIDGQILDPQMKMLAMDDTRQNDELTSVQKAILLNKIQKGEKIG